LYEGEKSEHGGPGIPTKGLAIKDWLDMYWTLALKLALTGEAKVRKKETKRP
jgi:hypothetical protein